MHVIVTSSYFAIPAKDYSRLGEILTTYNRYQPTVGNSYADGFSDNDWEKVLQSKLSHIELGLETLRRLRF